jgi:hypothetical protein
MMDQRDDDLERLFHAARTQDERRAPSFVQVVTRRPETKRAPVTALVMVLAALAFAAVAIWRYSAPNDAKLEIAFTPGDMHVPTDYLLDMMNFPRAGEVPRIGASDWYPLPLTGDAGIESRRTP